MEFIESKCLQFRAVTPAHHQIQQRLRRMNCVVIYNPGVELEDGNPWMVVGVPQGWIIEEIGPFVLFRTTQGAVRFVDFIGELDLDPEFVCIHTAQVRLNRVRKGMVSPNISDRTLEYVFDMLNEHDYTH